MALVARRGGRRTDIPELRGDCLPCSASNYPVADFRTQGTTWRATTKRDSVVWCSDDGSVRCCYSLYGTSSSHGLRENQSDRNRTVTGSMINFRDLLILNLTLQVFDGLFSYQIFSLGGQKLTPSFPLRSLVGV